MNLYTYCGNDGLNCTDPTGRELQPSVSKIQSFRRQQRERREATEQQNRDINRAQTTVVVGTLAVSGLVAAAPLVAAESPFIAGGVLGGEVAGVGNLTDQISNTGAIDPVELTLTTAQGFLFGAIGNKARVGAKDMGSNLPGQAGAVFLAESTAGQFANGLLEGLKSVASGETFGEGFGVGSLVGIGKAFTGGPASTVSPVAGAVTDVIVGT